MKKRNTQFQMMNFNAMLHLSLKGLKKKKEKQKKKQQKKKQQKKKEIMNRFGLLIRI